MELTLLKLVGLLRPMASMEFGQALFDAAAILLFVILVASFLFTSATRKTLNLSAIDIVIAAFALWCVMSYVIYYESSSFREVAKLLIPLASYSIAKTLIKEPAEYRAMLAWIIVGFSVPVILSVLLMLTGKGVDYVSFWTGVPRWQGAYTGAHSMGHSVALFLFVLVIYYRLRHLATDAADRGSQRKLVGAVVTVLGALAVYCLYMSQVRSAILGVMVFSVVYLFFQNRRLLIVGSALLAMVAVATTPYWVPALLPEVAIMQSGRADAVEVGSGRPLYWRHNLELFANRPLDQQLAGAGIGNRAETMHASRDQALDSHNDWLDLLLQTGAVGVALFVLLQLLILRAIRRMTGPERYLFLSLFLAVNAMMFVSNSYVWRIQVGHLYYIILAYIEISGCANRRTAVVPAANRDSVHREVPMHSASYRA
jgi:O-antigen ligase